MQLVATVQSVRFSKKPIPTKLYRSAIRCTKPKKCITPTVSAYNGAKVFGHCIVYYTIFYCSFNWYYYRKIRTNIEKIKREQEQNDDSDSN